MSNLPNIWKWKFGDSISWVEWLKYKLTTDKFDPIAKNSHSTKIDWNDRIFFCVIWHQFIYELINLRRKSFLFEL